MQAIDYLFKIESLQKTSQSGAKLTCTKPLILFPLPQFRHVSEVISHALSFAFFLITKDGY